MLQPTRSLKVFMAVAEELHFRKAAERLHMTQPPLSMHIKQLEEWIGVELFVRTTRSVQLTPAGKELQQRAVRLLEAFEEMTEAVRRVGTGQSGSLNLGFPVSTTFDILPRLLAAQRRRYPQVTLNLHEGTTAALLDALHARQVDVALVRASASTIDSSLCYQLAAREPLVLALLPSHPLARHDSVPIDSLHDVDFVGFQSKDAGYFRHLVTRLFQRHDIEPKLVHECTLPSMLAFVEAGLGVALVPASMARQRVGELAFRRLSSVSDDTDWCDLYGIWRRADANLMPLVKNFLEVVQSCGLSMMGAVQLPAHLMAPAQPVARLVSVS